MRSETCSRRYASDAGEYGSTTTSTTGTTATDLAAGAGTSMTTGSPNTSSARLDVRILRSKASKSQATTTPRAAPITSPSSALSQTLERADEVLKSTAFLGRAGVISLIPVEAT